ncbi:MAG: UbiA family prenyltransferase [Candidatus Thermoplasmatota archaeon]|nr:UbiA family prenyltransferase [Candidatus Thermoplasmatota archaeon]
MGASLTDVLGLYRLHTAMATASVAGIAAHIAGGGPALVVGAVAGSIFHHAWAFSLNEVADLEVDSRNPELSHKPLVSGRISRSGGVMASFIALALSFVLFSAGALLDGGDVFAVLILLSLSTLSGTIYDLWGKKFPLSDIFVSIWMGLLVLASAAGSGGWDPGSLGVIAVAVLSSVHILFNNSVEGGLKDVENDAGSGSRTLAVVTGCRIDRGKLVVSPVFFSWAVLLRASFVIGSAVFSLFIAEEAGWGAWVVVVVSILGAGLFTHALTFLRSGREVERKGMLRTFSLHELSSFGISLIVIIPAVGILPALAAFIAPVLWLLFFNRVIFGTGLAPKV